MLPEQPLLKDLKDAETMNMAVITEVTATTKGQKAGLTATAVTAPCARKDGTKQTVLSGEMILPMLLLTSRQTRLLHPMQWQRRQTVADTAVRVAMKESFLMEREAQARA